MLTSTSQEFLVLFVKRKCELLLLLTMLFSFYNNIYLSIRLFIINYYFIDLFKIRPESKFRL